MLHIDGLIYRIAGRAVIDGASLALPEGHRAALVGRNGGGKTTLLRLIAGDVQPDAGAIVLRPGARLGRVAQTCWCWRKPPECIAVATVPSPCTCCSPMTARKT